MSALDLIPGVATAKLIAVGVVVAGLAAGYWGVTHHYYRLGAADAAAKYDKILAEASAAALKASEDYHALELSRLADRAAAQSTFSQREAQHAEEIVSVHAAATADRVRITTALAAPRGSGPASNPAPTGSDCPTTAGAVLEQVLQFAADSTRDAEGNADAYRAMLAAWPRNPGQ